MEKKILHKTTPKVYEQIVHKKYRNYKWLMYLSIVGLSLMFLSLTFLYFVNHVQFKQPDLKIIPVFYWNTLVLLASSANIFFAKKYFREDNFIQYKTSLLLIMCLGLLFLVGQIVGWFALFSSGYHFTNHTAAYLYVISGIHAVHIIGGLIFLSFFISKSWRMLSNYATAIVYFTDPVTKSQLKLFGIFWHFLGVMWLYLLSFFIAIG